jgi:hypothetical protein
MTVATHLILTLFHAWLYRIPQSAELLAVHEDVLYESRDHSLDFGKCIISPVSYIFKHSMMGFQLLVSFLFITQVQLSHHIFLLRLLELSIGVQIHRGGCVLYSQVD